jgi:hypothetical protein
VSTIVLYLFGEILYTNIVMKKVDKQNTIYTTLYGEYK